MRHLLHLLGACTLAMAAALPSIGRPAPSLACIGGIPSLEFLSEHADLIVLGRAVRVGDRVNRAPTATATASPTATLSATATPTGAVSRTSTPATPTVPPSPSPPRPSWTPRSYNLAGIGMTLAVDRVYLGTPTASVDIDAVVRSGLERVLRDEEAGIPYFGGSCPLGAFIPRYVAGQRYLVFARGLSVDGLPNWYAEGVFVVSGDSVVLNDPLLVGSANNGFLYMSPATYGRFFAGVPTSYSEPVYLAPGTVPLASVLRAVAALRGDPSITPPQTGSAGLASGRP